MRKKIIIKELHLCSFKEKKAKVIKFHPQRNLISGQNRTGKSAISKSIYYTLGASVHFNKRWVELEVNTLLKFVVNDIEYSLFRKGSLFKLFDKDMNLIGTYSSVTKGLAPELSKIFGYKMKFTSRKGKTEIVPPAYMFLPFYIDQDKNWKNTSPLNTFNGLGQYNNWKKDIIEYYIGLKPDDYYELKADINSLKADKVIHEKEIDILKSIRSKHNEVINNDKAVEIDLNAFKKEIDSLMISLVSLKEKQDQYKAELGELYSVRNTISHQLSHVQTAQTQLVDDFDYSGTLSENIDCPTCGTEFQNNFSERFSIAQDIGEVTTMVCELQSDLDEINRKIDLKRSEEDSLGVEIFKIEESMKVKKEELTLNDFIQSQARIEVSKQLQIKINLERDLLNPILDEIKTKEDLLKGYNDKERVNSIKATYLDYMQKYLNYLKVEKLPQKAYKNYAGLISETGSDLTRAILAFHYSILHTILDRNETCAIFPFIVDSPNEGAQDDENLPLIYKFISEKTRNDTQCILATEIVPDTLDTSQFNVVEVSKRYSLLEEDEFAKESLLFSKIVSAELAK